jgi:hypothetical protein
MLANVEIIKNPKESMDRAYIFPSLQRGIIDSIFYYQFFRRNVRTGILM